MPWIRKVKVHPACTHPKLPDVQRYGHGSIWQCDHCDRKFQIEITWRVGKPDPLLARKVWMPYG